MTQEALMRFDPATGHVRPYPSHAGQWRNYHIGAAWLFNPWTGGRRDALDVGSDPFGLAVRAEGPNYAASTQRQTVGDSCRGSALRQLF